MRMLSLVVLLTLAGGVRAHGQMDPHVVPKRPQLPAQADSNSAADYYWFGVAQLSKEPERAAAAFYWASRIDPAWADPIYGRYVALLLAQPLRIIEVYLLRPAEDQREPRLRAIDSLWTRAVRRNPWVDRRMIGVVFSTWLQEVSDNGRVPRYIREQYPAFGAWLSYAEGKFDASAQEYATAIEKDPRNHQVYFSRALPFVALGRNDSAAASVRSALAAFHSSTVDSLYFGYVSSPFMEYSLGVLFGRQQQNDSAQAAYERALLEDVTFSPAHLELGRLLIDRGDSSGALKEFDQAVATDPSDAVALYELAILSLARGQPDSVLPWLQRATTLEPWFVAPRLALARLYDMSGYKDEAIREYQTFLQRAPRTMNGPIVAVRTRLASLGSAP